MPSKKHQARNRFIYCGLDDSNHGGQNTKSEIIVGVFSENSEDANIRKFPNRRDYDIVSRFLKKPKVSYIFTELPKDEAYSKHFNLPLIAPFFIKEYLSRNQEKIGPTQINLGFDGPLERQWLDILARDFEEAYGLDASIQYFTGKNKRVCTSSVYSADVIANRLFSLSFQDISTGPERFNIPLEDLAERLKVFR